LLYLVFFLFPELNENATLDRISSSHFLASIKGESRILLPVVHRFKRLGINGNNSYIVPCSLVLLVAANMSKSYCLAPHQWRKAVQRYCHFWNWQIFLQLFLLEVINIFPKNRFNQLKFSWLNHKNFFSIFFDFLDYL